MVDGNANHPNKRLNPALRLFLIFLGLFLFVGGFAAVIFWKDFVPNKEHVDPDFRKLSKPVFYKGSFFPESAIGEKEGLKLPLSLVQEWLDPSILYEQSSDSVIITTKDKVLRFKTSQLSAFMNEKPYTLQFPVEKKDDIVYVPIEPLRQLYQFELRVSDQTGAVILVKKGDHLQWGRMAKEKEAALRSGASIRYPIVSQLVSGEKLMIWGEDAGWYKVQQSSGYIGYVSKADVVLDHEESIPEQVTPEPFIPWKPMGGKINLTWEQVSTKNPDTAKIPAMPSLNVISPTWFSLADGDGNLTNLADPVYMKWTQERGYQVWALFSNGFEPKRTTAALSTYDRRMKMTKQLIGFAQMYKLKGINIDFENVATSDKENLVQFVREMTPLLHEQGLVVSIDVTPKSNSEMWSLFYDRPALAQTVDYMMLMAYDEHWATSPDSGSVGSLPWVEKSITRLLDEDHIPPSKLVLSIPFYTRLWTEELKDGKTVVTSKALGMESAQTIIKDKKLTPVLNAETGQNYVEYKEGTKLMRIWLEDETSVQARMELVKKYDLAGVASWRRGFETTSIWNAISNSLQKRP
ncbi:glycosyl hydrolase family 18 protein [Paenibacillus sp. GP183]|uniref:glycosyl hydrolase family 18 protein n=1 Tax=Paenibacillus sp. GP183 TaxID=1882751 RepID=UPI00089A9D29|nr:glycosyl hydrolase family 18 protein [Paenibacillus sp. GP183]SEC63014.1 Copper amine oxidase N-terminal domain-containing protein [Paenibacillus sp. GP183]